MPREPVRRLRRVLPRPPPRPFSPCSDPAGPGLCCGADPPPQLQHASSVRKEVQTQQVRPGLSCCHLPSGSHHPLLCLHVSPSCWPGHGVGEGGTWDPASLAVPRDWGAQLLSMGMSGREGLCLIPALKEGCCTLGAGGWMVPSSRAVQPLSSLLHSISWS